MSLFCRNVTTYNPYEASKGLSADRQPPVASEGWTGQPFWLAQRL